MSTFISFSLNENINLVFHVIAVTRLGTLKRFEVRIPAIYRLPEPLLDFYRCYRTYIHVIDCIEAHCRGTSRQNVVTFHRIRLRFPFVPFNEFFQAFHARYILSSPPILTFFYDSLVDRRWNTSNRCGSIEKQTRIKLREKKNSVFFHQLHFFLLHTIFYLILRLFQDRRYNIHLF